MSNDPFHAFRTTLDLILKLEELINIFLGDKKLVIFVGNFRISLSIISIVRFGIIVSNVNLILLNIIIDIYIQTHIFAF